MRRLDPEVMKQLAKLAQLRENLALASLAKLAARRRVETETLGALRAPIASAENPEDAAAQSKWLLWRDRQVAEANGRLATLAAEFSKLSEECGRTIAENAVIETLRDMSIRERDAEHEKRKPEFGSTGLHFLPDDVGDKDVLNLRPKD